MYFKKSYTICSEVGSPEDLHSAAVQYGIASAHVAMEGFAERLTVTDLSSVEVCIYSTQLHSVSTVLSFNICQ